ncbi:MAG: TIGR02757 family protein [Candidatus Gastranaerophilales bacterium]|nr:TIGR02757 family protein [Candidatus Gastranaerophilales bacterium]
MKKKLNELVLKYETSDFIKSDPIQFPHKYENKTDIEIAAFISALFAFGKREQFIKKLDFIFSLTKTPFELIYDFKKYDFDNFIYRFIKSVDLIELLRLLNKLYVIDKMSLEELFNSKNRFLNVSNYFYSNSKCPNNMGFCFMFAKPENNSALKRMNMFLRWMIRDGAVDFGIWKTIKKSELLIPLDTHVARLSREFGLLKRTQNDFRAVLELTEKLKEFDNDDPIKYDFALFGLGVEQANKKS